jgi:hypothetical protein
MFTKIKDNLPLISIGLLTTSLIRIVAYYNYFDIDIMSYIEISESLTLSMPFIIVGTMLIAAVLAITFYNGEKEPSKEHNEIAKALQEAESIVIRLKVHFKLFQIIIGIIMPLTLLVPGLYSLYKHNHYGEVMIWASIFMALMVNYKIFIIETMMAFRRNNISYLSFAPALTISYIPALIFLCVYLSRLNAIYTAHNPIYNIAVFKTDKETITTSKEYRFVGKTKNYIFFYNNVSGIADAYPLNEMKVISTKQVQ